jgi:hypothetical protein
VTYECTATIEHARLVLNREVEGVRRELLSHAYQAVAILSMKSDTW